MKDDNIELFLFPETLKKNYSIEVSVGNVKRQWSSPREAFLACVIQNRREADDNFLLRLIEMQ